MNKTTLAEIQKQLEAYNFDGWLIYDFRKSNDLAHTLLGFQQDIHLTRRFYYFIPRQGEPVKIVHAIESFQFDFLPGIKKEYADYASLHNCLKETLKDSTTIAMEYSHLSDNPYVAKVDAGTIELVKSFGVEVKSSGNLITNFLARWSREQFEENIPVANTLYEIVYSAFGFIAKRINANENVTEYDVQQFILGELANKNLWADGEPCVSVNENSAVPHYGPTKEVFSEIKKGDFVLMDFWSKANTPTGVYTDITWVGYVGKEVPEKYSKIAKIVFDARDAAFNFVSESFAAKKEIHGYEVDDAARKVIADAGYGKYFIHRTGHSITTDGHGCGTHMDNYETKDERLILPMTSFSIEPGIYLPGEFGVRSEIDVFITEDGKVISTGGERQREVIAILK